MGSPISPELNRVKHDVGRFENEARDKDTHTPNSFVSPQDPPPTLEGANAGRLFIPGRPSHNLSALSAPPPSAAEFSSPSRRPQAQQRKGRRRTTHHCLHILPSNVDTTVFCCSPSTAYFSLFPPTLPPQPRSQNHGSFTTAGWQRPRDS